MDNREIFGKLKAMRQALVDIENQFIGALEDSRLFTVLEKTDDKLIVSKKLPENVVTYKELMADYEVVTEFKDRTVFKKRQK